MKKSLLALAAVATLAVSMASPAYAWRGGWGPGIGLGLLLAWAAAPGWTELTLMWPDRVGGIAAGFGEPLRIKVERRLILRLQVSRDQLVHHNVRERVHLVGTVERDGQDVVRDLVFDLLVICLAHFDPRFLRAPLPTLAVLRPR